MTCYSHFENSCPTCLWWFKILKKNLIVQCSLVVRNNSIDCCMTQYHPQQDNRYFKGSTTFFTSQRTKSSYCISPVRSLLKLTPLELWHCGNDQEGVYSIRTTVGWGVMPLSVLKYVIDALVRKWLYLTQSSLTIFHSIHVVLKIIAGPHQHLWTRKICAWIVLQHS